MGFSGHGWNRTHHPQNYIVKYAACNHRTGYGCKKLSAVLPLNYEPICASDWIRTNDLFSSDISILTKRSTN